MLRDVAEDANRACCHLSSRSLPIPRLMETGCDRQNPALPSAAPVVLLLSFLLASVT